MSARCPHGHRQLWLGTTWEDCRTCAKEAKTRVYTAEELRTLRFNGDIRCEHKNTVLDGHNCGNILCLDCFRYPYGES